MKPMYLAVPMEMTQDFRMIRKVYFDLWQMMRVLNRFGVTYRTLVNAGPNTRRLLEKNMVVASIECNPVYNGGSALIGMPVIPVEEALTILHDDYAAHKSDKRIRALLRSFQVATIDPRWFWSFFVVDKAHNDLLGYDYPTLLELERVVSGAEKTKEDKPNDIGLIHRIFRHLNYNRPAFYSNSGNCEKDVAEPSMDIIVWKDIASDDIHRFYNFNQVRYDGKWRLSVKKTEGGYNLVEENLSIILRFRTLT